jgi:nucleotide-binding universal stress UspA family protein
MFSLAKILLPVDFSDRSAGAARYAVQLASHFQSEITLLHVLSSIAPPPHEYPELYVGAVPADFLEERRARSARDLDNFLTNELSYPLLSRVLVEGDPAQQITDCAHSGHFDVILMPTHGHGPFRRLLLGSVTAKVLHDAACPVWTSVHADSLPSFGAYQPKYVLCAIDLGPESAVELEWAAGFCAAFKAQLGIVHVVSLDPRTEAYYFSPEWRGQILDNARSEIDQLQAAAGTKAEVQLELGDVRKAVCNAAKRVHADLLVTGRGGAAGIGGRLASHTYSIIRDSPCPVVSV